AVGSRWSRPRKVASVLARWMTWTNVSCDIAVLLNPCASSGAAAVRRMFGAPRSGSSEWVTTAAAVARVQRCRDVAVVAGPTAANQGPYHRSYLGLCAELTARTLELAEATT